MIPLGLKPLTSCRQFQTHSLYSKKIKLHDTRLKRYTLKMPTPINSKNDTHHTPQLTDLNTFRHTLASTTNIDVQPTTELDTAPQTLRIVSANINGLLIQNSHRSDAVHQFIIDEYTTGNPVSILILTETWVRDYRRLESWFNFSAIRTHYSLITDQPKGAVFTEEYRGKGVLMFVLKSIQPFIQKTERVPGRII